jgi:cysteinyl-tRNA synthetase
MNAYNDDLRDLGVLTPTVQPKVSDHMEEIIMLIERLISRGYAYERGGDVYYRVEAFESYGALSGQKLSHMQHSEREGLVICADKDHEHDFALWKARKSDEIAWDSPWGLGRPGWHIECSAMAMKYLSESFDIHGGGLDLCFPHHDNEIAQSEGATGKPFARTWMHNNYVTVEGVKMSKSLGNFTTVRDALQTFSGSEIRWFYLSNHYRSPIDYSETSLLQARANLTSIQNVVQKLSFQAQKTSQEILDLSAHTSAFHKAMNDDFNSAEAITVILGLVTEANKAAAPFSDAYLTLLYELSGILGFSLRAQEVFVSAEEQEMVAKRDELKRLAKEAKDKSLYAKADEIRKELASRGVILEDTPQGTKVTKL